MRPVKVAQSNIVYRGPTAEIGDLWCQRVSPGQIASVWEPSDEERQLLAEGGRVELVLWSEPIPPISLAVLAPEDSEPVSEHPFRVPPEAEAEERVRQGYIDAHRAGGHEQYGNAVEGCPLCSKAS